MILLIKSGMEGWFKAMIESQWGDYQIMGVIQSLINEEKIETKLIQNCILTDYEKLEGTERMTIAKRKPLVKDFIIKVTAKIHTIQLESFKGQIHTIRGPLSMHSMIYIVRIRSTRIVRIRQQIVFQLNF